MASPSSAQPVLPPAWLPHRYDPDHDAVHLVEAGREHRRSIPFLIDEHLPTATAPMVVSRSEALAVAPTSAAVHFIFHSAYCCSTLLANALDVPGVASSLKEPQILNDLVGWRLRGGQPAAIGQVLESSLRLLSRPFEAGEACVIKPSNVVNGLAGAMLATRPEAGSVLLYAPLRAFLASIARKGMWGRMWVRELLSRQLQEGLLTGLGFEPRDYLLHTDLQAAAVGWLAQHRLFAELARRWPERVRTLDSEVLVARPEEALAACASLFGLRLDEEQVRETVAHVFARNAKDGSAFTPGQREADRRAGEALHAEEVDKVTAWAEAVAEGAGMSLELPAPLLGPR